MGLGLRKMYFLPDTILFILIKNFKEENGYIKLINHKIDKMLIKTELFWKNTHCLVIAF